MPHVLFHSGGPYHPVTAQAALIASWLPVGWTVEVADGIHAFDRLASADIYVAAGLHWTGIGDGSGAQHKWPRLSRPCSYVRPTEAQRYAWRKFVASGRPVLSFHGGIASYDDWLDYGKLLGFRWLWGVTKHSDYRDWNVVAASDKHPVVASVPERFTVRDEIYYNVQVEADIRANVWAWAEPGGLRCPLLVTGQGGRIDGAGRCAYFANGHSEETFASKELRTLLVNTLSWLAMP